MQTTDISEHFTPLDRSVLVGENAYIDYFKYIRFALESLLNSFDNYKGDEPYEVEIIKSLSQRMLNTMNAFTMKYTFNDTHPMLVDLTESGFPNYLEFKRLEDDLNKRFHKLKNSRSVDTLKMQILDQLIKAKEVPENLLKQASLRSYYETIDCRKLFTEFTDGGIRELKKLSDRKRRFLYHWGSFDQVTNRPYIYLLVFEYEGEDFEAGLNNRDFKEEIKRITHNTAPLRVMISDIDHLRDYLMPKILKRIDLGPIFGRYSKDEHPYTQFLAKHFDADDFIMTYNTEVIFSIGEKRTRSFLSKGELRQVFYIDESNKECMEKMISSLHKYMITTHSVLQYLSEYHKEEVRDLAALPYIYRK